MMGWDISRTALILVLGVLLLAAGIEDVRTREISNRKTATIALLAPLWWVTNGLTLWPGVPAQIGLALLVFAVFATAFHLNMMGGGDVKLIAALALWLPLAPLLWMLMAMSLVGGVVTLAMLVDRHVSKSRRDIEIPYGVAIAIAGLLVLREPVLNQFL